MRLIDGDALIAWIKESQHMTSKMRNIICKVETMPSADRPTEVIYGNEHNCIMTIFGECSYAETGCGDCTVVEKVRKALSADRPQGEWIKFGLGRGTRILFCTNCERRIEMPLSQGDSNYDYCPNCGARMKGADDEFHR